MKALLIGGTGTISSAVARRAVAEGWEVIALNRGHRDDRLCPGVTSITCDVGGDETTLSSLVKDMEFDVVVDFIAFVPGHLERDVRVFAGKTRQFMFISSASAYQKPLNHHVITEATPLANPLWEYSRNKIACENYLLEEYRKRGFPCTIVRPSHTYDERSLPVAVHGKKGSWQVVDRILRGKPVLVHGDGTSLWTMTWSDDFAQAFFGLMGNPFAIGETVHITSDETLTWNQIYDRLGDALGKAVKKYHVTTDFLSHCDPEFLGTLAGDKSNSVVFDNAKIKRLVPGYRATVRFDEGVRLCARYLLGTPAAQIPDPQFEAFCDRVIHAQESAKSAYFSSIRG